MGGGPLAEAKQHYAPGVAGLRSRLLHRVRTSLAVVGLLGLCAAMGLPNLGQRRFWQDEAETAVIARNICRYRVPRVYDGRNLVTVDGGRDFNADYLLTSKPWLPYYLAAAGQALLGMTNLSGRLPFVLCTLAAILWLGASLRRLSPALALFGTGYMVTSVPLWLLARQARYYGLAILLTVGTMALYVAWLQEDRDGWRPARWILPWILLAHTHYLGALYVGAGIGVHFAVTQNGRRRWRQIVLTLAAASVGVVPWLIYTSAGQWFQGSRAAARPDFTGMLGALFVSVIGLLVLPVLFLTILADFGSGAALRQRWREPWVQLAWVTLATTLLLNEVITGCKLAPPYTRYLIVLLPSYAVLFAAAAAALTGRSLLLGMAAVAAVQFTTAPGAIVGMIVGEKSPLYDPSVDRLQVPMRGFLHELSSPYRGPLDCVMEELSARSRPSDDIFIEFEAEPIIWYTDLRVLRELPFTRPPDWIVLRGTGGGTLHFVLLNGLDPAAAPTRSLPWWRVGEAELAEYERANHRYIVQ